MNKLRNIIRFSNINLHSDILNIGEIQKAIYESIPTKEQQFIEQIQRGFINHKLWKQIKHNYIHQNEAIRIIESLTEIKDSYQQNTTELVQLNETQRKNSIIKEDIYNYFLEYFSRRYEKLTFSQIATVLENYAYANRFDQQFFRIMENEIYERLDDPKCVVNYKDIGKILWAYQFCNYGSAVLFDRLAKIIKIAQNEIDPITLAYYANLYSKSPENMKGGFGIYKLAEEKLMERMKTYDFNQLVRIAKHLFTPNIGSNAFQTEIEERLEKQFPKIDSLQPSQLVKLCKSTSKYYFKFNDKALFHKIESACINLLPDLKDKQFSEIMWSYVRSRRGNHILYDLFEKELNKRQKLLSMRQLVILFLNCAQHVETQNLAKQLKNIIQAKLNDDINLKPTYIAYLIMSSLNSQLQYNIELEQKQISALSTKTKILLLQTIHSALPKAKEIKLALQLIENLSTLELELLDQLQLHYFANKFRRYPLSTLQELPEFGSNIPKAFFHQAFYLNPTSESFHKTLLMLQQTQQDQLRFCFNQNNWVVIAWVLLSEHLLNKERLINKELIEQACLGIKEIDINTIDNIELYSQSLWMTCLIENQTTNFGIKKLKQLQSNKLNDFIQTTALLQNVNDVEIMKIQECFVEAIQQQCQNIEYQDQSIINMYDYKNFVLLHNVYVLQTEFQTLKFALILIMNNDFIKDVNEQDILIKLGQYDQRIINLIQKKHRLNKLILEQMLDWNVEYIYYDQFKQLNREEQINYLKQLFYIEQEINNNEQINEQYLNKRKESLQQKRKSFKDKLQQSSKDASKQQYQQDDKLQGVEEL